MSKHAEQQANQPEAIKRTTLQKSDVPGTNYETVFGIAEIAPNTDFASHTHPGTESGYLMEGSITHIVKGQPKREVKAGDSVLILAGVAHSGLPDRMAPRYFQPGWSRKESRWLHR